MLIRGLRDEPEVAVRPKAQGSRVNSAGRLHPRRGGFYVLGTAGLVATLSRILCRMPIPQPIDPRRLAAEIDASVAEFKRLVALACAHHIGVVAELKVQVQGDGPDRPVLAVQVIAPL